MILISSSAFVIMKKVDPKYSAKINLALTIGYLSYVHLKLQFASDFTKEFTVTVHDIIIMIHVQKITSLSYGLEDFLLSKKKELELSTSRKKFMVGTCPSFLEYNSFLYNFMGVMCGPHLFYSQYKMFIEYPKSPRG